MKHLPMLNDFAPTPLRSTLAMKPASSCTRRARFPAADRQGSSWRSMVNEGLAGLAPPHRFGGLPRRHCFKVCCAQGCLAIRELLLSWRCASPRLVAEHSLCEAHVLSLKRAFTCRDVTTIRRRPPTSSKSALSLVNPQCTMAAKDARNSAESVRKALAEMPSCASSKA